MGSHSTQGIGITVFLLSFVFLGLAFAGGGILSFLAFLVLFSVAIVIMRKCKAMEEAAE